MTETCQYASMANSLSMLEHQLRELQRRWESLAESRWADRSLRPSLAETEKDLDRIRVFVDSSQREIKQVEERLKDKINERDELRHDCQQKSLEVKMLQDELRMCSSGEKTQGSNIKNLKEQTQQLELAAKALRSKKRQVTAMAHMEAVVFAHCTRLVEPRLRSTEKCVEFQPLDPNTASPFTAKLCSYDQNWNELSQYHGLNISGSGEGTRPKSRAKRRAPSGLNTQIQPEKRAARCSITM